MLGLGARVRGFQAPRLGVLQFVEEPNPKPEPNPNPNPKAYPSPNPNPNPRVALTLYSPNPIALTRRVACHGLVALTLTL